MKGKIDVLAWLRHVSSHEHDCFIVSAGSRPGARSYFALLEWRHFPPGCGQDAHFAGLEWEGTAWAIAAFPASFERDATALARAMALKLVAGAPAVLGTGGLAGAQLRFPGHAAKGMRVLENDFSQPVYRDLRHPQAVILQRELEVIRRLGRGHALLPGQIVDFIYGDGELPPDPPPLVA